MALTDGLWAQILEASRAIHASGSISPGALLRLARHLEEHPPRDSAETGTGASTLVFSHLSQAHTVFAVDTDRSITTVRRHALLNRETTTFVDGPAQRTLPAQQFTRPLQAVLIDGPHAFPFPELEYFYLYPHIERDGLLVIDDIHIPSIQNLFRFLREDDMFRLLEVCGKTAFFRRTAAATFDPWGDGWWLQGYNRRTLWRYGWRDRLKAAVPESLRPILRKYADRFRLRTRR
jgi:hypothetical protein